MHCYRSHCWMGSVGMTAGIYNSSSLSAILRVAANTSWPISRYSSSMAWQDLLKFDSLMLWYMWSHLALCTFKNGIKDSVYSTGMQKCSNTKFLLSLVCVCSYLLHWHIHKHTYKHICVTTHIFTLSLYESLVNTRNLLGQGKITGTNMWLIYKSIQSNVMVH